MKLGSLFTGLGLLDDGILAAWPGSLVWFAESAGADAKTGDKRRALWCNEVVAARHPGALALDDVTSIDGRPLPAVDVLALGFPCKGVSPAGDRAGLANAASGLWSEVPRILREMATMPTVLIIENSGALPSRGLDQVLTDLHTLGYDASWQVIGAVGVGAPHIRARTAIIATRDGTLPLWSPLEPWADRWLADHWTPAAEPLPRVVAPLPRTRALAAAVGWRIGAVAALGNAVVRPWAMYVATAARDRVPTSEGIVGALRWRARSRCPRAGVMVGGRRYETAAVYVESAAIERVLRSPIAAVYGELLPSVAKSALMPTATARDYRSGVAGECVGIHRLNAKNARPLNEALCALLPTAVAADSRSPGVRDGRHGGLSALLPTALAPTPTVSGNYNRRGASTASGDGLATAFDRGRATLIHPIWLAWFMGHDPSILGPIPEVWATDCDPLAESTTSRLASPDHDRGPTARTWR